MVIFAACPFSCASFQGTLKKIQMNARQSLGLSVAISTVFEMKPHRRDGSEHG
jgi:hypothetical protein